MTLQEMMEMNQVVEIGRDGTARKIPYGESPHIPEIDLQADWDECGDPHTTNRHEREFVHAMHASGWDVFQGLVTHGVYLGPVIHPSYYIGGSLEEIIRGRPGLWVQVPVDMYPPGEGEPTSAGWAILYRGEGE